MRISGDSSSRRYRVTASPASTSSRCQPPCSITVQPEAVVQHGPVIPPVLRVGDGHGDQGAAILLRRPHQNAPGPLGKAGFYPNGPGVLPEELVVVHQLPVPRRIASGGDDLPEPRGIQGRHGDFPQFPGSGVVFFAVKAVGVGKVGISEAQYPGLFVHSRRKRLDAPGGVQGQRRRRLIPR